MPVALLRGALPVCGRSRLLGQDWAFDKPLSSPRPAPAWAPSLLLMEVEGPTWRVGAPPGEPVPGAMAHAQEVGAEWEQLAKLWRSCNGHCWVPASSQAFC